MKNDGVPILIILFTLLVSPILMASSENNRSFLSDQEKSLIELQGSQRVPQTTGSYNNEDEINSDGGSRSDAISWWSWQSIWSSLKNSVLVSLKIDGTITQNLFPISRSISDKCLSRLVAELGQDYKSNPYYSADKENSWNDLYLNSIASAQSNNIITVGMMSADIPNLTLIEKIQNRLREAGISEAGDLGIIMQNSQNIDAILEGIEKLAQTQTEQGNMLTRENFQALIAKVEHAREVAEGLVVLQEGGILTKDNRQILFKLDAEFIESMAKGLVQSAQKKRQESDQRKPAQEAPQKDISQKKSIKELEKESSPKNQGETDKQAASKKPQQSVLDENLIQIRDTHWYNDDEINALLRHYVGKQVGEGLIDAISLSQLAGATLADNLRDRIAQLEETAMGLGNTTNTIILPINLGNFNPDVKEAGNHWAVLYIYQPRNTPTYFPSSLILPDPTITYIDPFGGEVPDRLWSILQRQYSLRDRNQIINPRIQFQSDGYNCGPWMVEILRHLVESNGLYVTKEGFKIHAARYEHWNILEQNSFNIVQQRIADWNQRHRAADPLEAREDTSQTSVSMIGGNSRVEEIKDSKFVMRDDSRHEHRHQHKHYHFNGLNNQELEKSDTEDEDIIENDGPTLDLQEQSNLVANYYAREQSANIAHLTERIDQHGVLAITGIAGAGKSQLAYYYAHKVFKGKYPNAFIITIPCDSADILNASYRDFAIELGLSEDKYNIKNFDEIKTHVKKRLQSKIFENKPFILIFDGADDLTIEDIASYFPKNLQGESQQIIITSQREEFFQIAGQNFYIDGFTLKEAIGFLQEGSTIKYEDAKKLAKEFSNLPLGLQCAKMYIKATRVSVDEYIRRLKEQNTEESEDRLMRKQGYYKGKKTGHRTQRAAIGLAIKQLSGRAKYLLKSCSFFNNDKISRPILEYLLALQASEFDFAAVAAPAVLDDILLELKEYSLLVSPEQRDKQKREIRAEEEQGSQEGGHKGEKRLTMHQVVQKVAKIGMNKDEEKELIDHFAKYFSSTKVDDEDIESLYSSIYSSEVNLTPHVEEILLKAIELCLNKRKKIHVDETKDPTGATALIRAAYNDHARIVNLLIEERANINKANNQEMTALMAASYLGHSAVVEILIRRGADVNKRDSDGVTALLAASQKGHTEIVKLLLENGADPTVSGGRHKGTVVNAAFENNHDEIVKLLLKKEADLAKDPLIPIAFACGKRLVKNLEFYIESVEDINLSSMGRTALIIASREGHLEMVKLLLEKGADMSKSDDKGMTTLMIAIENGSSDVAKLLLEKGVDMSKSDDKGMTTLMIAIENGSSDVAKLLLRNTDRATVNKTDEHGQTALMIASRKGDLEIVELLLKKGADVNIINKSGQTSVMLGLSLGRTRLVSLLLDENNIDVNHADKDGVTPLMMASRNGDLEMVKLLLSKKAEINSARDDGRTAFMIALQYNHIDVAKFLLEKGASKTNSELDAAFMIALQRSHIDLAKFLLGEGASINQTNSDGDTVFMMACQEFVTEKGFFEKFGIIKRRMLFLIDNRADINQSNDSGQTPLMLASLRGEFSLVQFLTDWGAEINKTNQEGGTALMIAAVNGHIDVVKLLLEKRAEIDRANNDGLTALMIASQKGHSEVVKLLLEKVEGGKLEGVE